MSVSAFTPDPDRPALTPSPFFQFTAPGPPGARTGGGGVGGGGLRPRGARTPGPGFRRGAQRSRGPARLYKVFLSKGRGGRSEAPL